MRRSVAAMFAAGVTVSLLVGCSDDSDDSADRSTTASSIQSTTTGSTSPIPDSAAATVGGGDLRADCAGLTPDDLKQIFGPEFDTPVPSSGGNSTVDDINYQTVGCSFESVESESAADKIEVDLDLSFAEHFSNNTVQCIEPSDHIHPVTPVPGLGNQAWWQPGDFENSTDAEGELTVCVDDALIAVEIEGPADLRQTLQEQATEIARIVVG